MKNKQTHGAKRRSLLARPLVCIVLMLVCTGFALAQEQTEEDGETTSVAQEKEVKNWISGEVSILGGGARYERMLTEKMSIGANAYWTTLILFTDLEVGASFRYYVWRQILFVGGGLGFHMYRGTYIDWFAYVTGVALTPEIGFRIDVGDTGGFFLQPGLKIPITFGAVSLDTGNRFRVGVGVVPYLGLGGAFKAAPRLAAPQPPQPAPSASTGSDGQTAQSPTTPQAPPQSAPSSTGSGGKGSTGWVWVQPLP